MLVFCSSKDQCGLTAVRLAENLAEYRRTLGGGDTKPLRSAALTKLLHQLQGTPFGLDERLAQAVPQGVGVHHAGLTNEERTLLEKAFRAGVLPVLCATSTLAAGVNLPARLVLFRGLRIGTQPIDPVHYRQMSGRAGRAGKDTLGESIIVLSRPGGRPDRLWQADLQAARQLMNAPMPDVRSHLTAPGDGARVLLECMAAGLVSAERDLDGLVTALLRWHELAPDGRSALGSPGHAALMTRVREVRLSACKQARAGYSCGARCSGPADAVRLAGALCGTHPVRRQRRAAGHRPRHGDCL